MEFLRGEALMEGSVEGSTVESSTKGSIEGTFIRFNWMISWLDLCTILLAKCRVKLCRKAEFLLKTSSRKCLSHLAPMLKMPTKVPISKSDPTRTSQTGFSSRLWIWIRLLSAALCWSKHGMMALRLDACKAKQPVLTKEEDFNFVEPEWALIFRVVSLVWARPFTRRAKVCFRTSRPLVAFDPYFFNPSCAY